MSTATGPEDARRAANGADDYVYLIEHKVSAGPDDFRSTAEIVAAHRAKIARLAAEISATGITESTIATEQP